MWASKRFDLDVSDLAYAAVRCLVPTSREDAEARIQALVAPGNDVLACLSVRSAFDLFLEAHTLPRGSAVAFSAMTVADMPRIAREHGLTPVPCDLAPDSAAPGVAELESACSPDTRVVVLAHLFGSRMDVAPLVSFCHERGILMVEDCAQAYAGPDYGGHPDSDLVLFSFGPIKHATALGGGLARVRDPAVRARMRRIHVGWPVQPRDEYLGRVIKYAGLHLLSGRPAYTLVAGAGRVLGVDVDGVVNRLTRGFPGPEFFRRIRRRPSVPLLETLARRLSQDVERFVGQEARVRSLLAEHELYGRSPGASAEHHTFWLLPILAPDPAALVADLRAHGFDATRGRSFAVVGGSAALEAEQVHRQAVYVPVYPAMPDSEVKRLGGVLGRALGTDG